VAAPLDCGPTDGGGGLVLVVQEGTLRRQSTHFKHRHLQLEVLHQIQTPVWVTDQRPSSPIHYRGSFICLGDRNGGQTQAMDKQRQTDRAARNQIVEQNLGWASPGRVSEQGRHPSMSHSGV